MSDSGTQQSEILRKNVAATIEMQRKEVEERTVQDRVAAWITDFSGSMLFVYLHAIWFGLWILLNLGIAHIPIITNFDPYPFGLLTLVVSLEAIFLSTFVLIAQNNLAAVSERRAELDLQVNLLAEQKSAKILAILDEIAHELDRTHKKFTFIPDPEVETLKVSPEPQEVLQVIEETIKEQSEVVERKVSEAAAEVAGEVQAVRDDVEQVSEKVEEVVSDVQQIKAGIGGELENKK